MDITQKDRDALRAAQDKLNPSFHIGKIVEHKIQDPKKYKLMSREEQGLKPDVHPDLPRLNYISSYLNDDRIIAPETNGQTFISNMTGGDLTIISEDEKQDIPITIEDVHANMWLNMDTIEFDKMEWMSNRSERVYQEKIKSGVQFNRDGLVVPASKINEHVMQTHDVSSLVKLLDSTFHPQITYSLNVITKIANLASLGFYDASFDQNIHETFLKDCLLRVRHHLDSPNETICQSALKCLRSLICNTLIDEILLDRCSSLNADRVDGFWSNGINSKEFDDEMKDSECVENDAILALVIRTDLLTRFFHLLETKIGRYENTYFNCILDILVRIARHSREMCFVLASEGFPTLVIKNFLPVAITLEDKSRQILTIKALKFIRIIAQASREFQDLHTVQKIHISSDITKIIGPYYYLDCLRMPSDQKKYLHKLHIESLRLMKALALLDGFSKEIYNIMLMDLSYLNTNFLSLSKLQSMTPISFRVSFDWQYAASLIDLTGTIMGYERYNARNAAIMTLWGSQLGPISMQWIHDLIKENVIPHIDVSITLSTLVGYVKRFDLDKNKSTQCFSILNSMLFASNDMRKGDTNAGLAVFNHLLQEATNRSHLHDILEIDGRRRDPTMLPSFGCLNFNTGPNYSTTFNSVIDNNSPFILLEMYVTLMNANHQDLQDFLNSVYLGRYIKLATKYHTQSLQYESLVQQSMMAQNEIFIMGSLILLMAKYFSQTITQTDAESEQVRSYCEPFKIAKYRTESYSQFFFEAISLIGLIDPTMQHSVAIKDQILEGVILNNELHLRLSDESHRRHQKKEDLSYRDFNYKNGDFNFNSLDLDLLKKLRTIYLHCEQPGRFWIFQPLIDHYKHQINNVSEVNGKRVDTSFWFNTLLGEKINDDLGQQDCRSDESIISGILILNATLMRHCPSYNICCIQPNLEEYLCLVGSIFIAENELFLDPTVTMAIQDNMLSMFHECSDDLRIFRDATKKIETLGLVLADYFNKIVDQYEAASFGDVAFSNFLLLFLNPESDKVFKRSLFSEKLETCLGQLRVSLGAVWANGLMFFKKKEEDSEIIGLIKRARCYFVRGSFLELYCKFHSSE